MIKIKFLAIVVFLLSVSISFAMAQEMTTSPISDPDYGYSMKTRNNGEIAWEIKDSEGAILDLAEGEKHRILREIIFPRALKHAAAGKMPEVWSVGFFYLDGIATEKDLEAATIALRRGLKVNRPDVLIFLANYYHIMAVAEKREKYFRISEELYLEVLAAGFDVPAANMTPLASTYIRGKHGVKKDLDKAEELLVKIDKAHPEDPLVQLKMAELRYRQKRYSEAFDYAENAENGLLENPRKLKVAKSYKILSAMRGGDLSKIDAKEFMTMGLKGPAAWTIPSSLLLALVFLLWRTRRAWRKEPGEGPGLWLTQIWIVISILGAGIGFTISLPGLDNMVGRWIGAILITAAFLIAVTIGGWGRYFGTSPICAGPKAFFKGLGIMAGCIVGLWLILLGYQELYELVTGHGLDQQLVTLFMKSENLRQLSVAILIVGIAIPFYEEVIYRGFLFDSLHRRWGTKTALVVSSVFFALVHGLTFAIPLMCLAFALGWARIKTGNLKMSFLIHAANNTASVLIGYFFAS